MVSSAAGRPTLNGPAQCKSYHPYGKKAGIVFGMIRCVMRWNGKPSPENGAEQPRCAPSSPFGMPDSYIAVALKNSMPGMLFSPGQLPRRPGPLRHPAAAPKINGGSLRTQAFATDLLLPRGSADRADGMALPRGCNPLSVLVVYDSPSDDMKVVEWGMRANEFKIP